jgi:hypothetical protein
MFLSVMGVLLLFLNKATLSISVSTRLNKASVGEKILNKNDLSGYFPM